MIFLFFFFFCMRINRSNQSDGCIWQKLLSEFKNCMDTKYTILSALYFFFCLLRCGPNSVNKSSNCPADILKCVWKQSWYSFNSFNHEILPALLSLENEVDEPRISIFSYSSLETSEPAHQLTQRKFLFAVCFLSSNFLRVHMLHNTFVISCCFFATHSVSDCCTMLFSSSIIRNKAKGKLLLITCYLKLKSQNNSPLC